MKIWMDEMVVVLDEPPKITFYWHRNDDDFAEFTEDGNVVLKPCDKRLLYSLPSEPSEIEIGNHLFGGLRVDEIDPEYGTISYVFRLYEEINQ